MNCVLESQLESELRYREFDKLKLVMHIARKKMKHFIKIFTTTYLMLVILNVYADRTAGTYVDDSVLHSKVKTELVFNDFFGGMEINIEVSNGVVQLAGFVDSQKQREKAGKSAENVAGVIRLSNQLHVKSGKRSSGQVVDDTLIASQVKAGLGGDLSINVDVYNGVVLLSGFVNSPDEKQTAIDVAKSIDHVKKIIAGIDTAD